MTDSLWGPTMWVPNPWPPLPEDPPLAEPPPDLAYDPWEVGVYQTADWTCACASSAWLLNSIADDRLGRRWQEWDVVNRLREATYPGAVSPSYGLARADMYDLEVMFGTLGYAVQRKQRITLDDLMVVAGKYPLQVNGARWYHHSGLRELGPGVAHLANPSPSWRGVGTSLDANEAALWGTWNGLWIVGRN